MNTKLFGIPIQLIRYFSQPLNCML